MGTEKIIRVDHVGLAKLRFKILAGISPELLRIRQRLMRQTTTKVRFVDLRHCRRTFRVPIRVTKRGVEDVFILHVGVCELTKEAVGKPAAAGLGASGLADVKAYSQSANFSRSTRLAVPPTQPLVVCKIFREMPWFQRSEA